MPDHGGKRPGAGRPKGSLNAATKAHQATIAEMARTYADAAMASLAQISASGESESARVAASVAILDRAFGKPVQAINHAGGDGGPIITRIVIEAATDDDSDDQATAET